MAGFLFLLPRLAASVPALSLPLGIAGLFAALPLLVVRIGGRFAQAAQALGIAFVLVALTALAWRFNRGRGDDGRPSSDSERGEG